MKVMMIPLIVLSAVAGGLSEEPNEAQMRDAFEQALTVQINNAMEFVAESGGPQAVQQLRQDGNDRFELRAFQKHGCVRLVGQRGFRCDFAAAIHAGNVSLRQSLTGRFFAGPYGIMFALEAQNASLPSLATFI